MVSAVEAPGDSLRIMTASRSSLLPAHFLTQPTQSPLPAIRGRLFGSILWNSTTTPAGSCCHPRSGAQHHRHYHGGQRCGSSSRGNEKMPIAIDFRWAGEAIPTAIESKP
jgi:hypothetical protein